MRSIESTKYRSGAPTPLLCDPAINLKAQATGGHLDKCADTFSRGTFVAPRPRFSPGPHVDANQVSYDSRRKLSDEDNQSAYTAIVIVMVVIGSIFLVILAGTCIYQAWKKNRPHRSINAGRPPVAPPRPAVVELNG